MSYRDGARRVAPLAVAVGAFGVSFGVLARDAGMGVVAPLVMSATTFAGAAQFAALSVLGSGGALFAAIAAPVLLNARYVPVGVSVAPALHGPVWRRLLEAQLVVDESWAVANVGGGRFDRKLLVGAGGVLWLVWMIGTTLGVLGGRLLGDPSRLGLDAAFPALFLGLLVAQRRTRGFVLVAVLGAGVALALVPLTPVGAPLVAASLVALLGLARDR